MRPVVELTPAEAERICTAAVALVACDHAHHDALDVDEHGPLPDLVTCMDCGCYRDLTDPDDQGEWKPPRLLARLVDAMPRPAR